MRKKARAKLEPFPAVGLVTDEQVARYLGVTAKTIWDWAGRGIFPRPLKISERTTRWRVRDIHAFIESKSGQEFSQTV